MLHHQFSLFAAIKLVEANLGHIDRFIRRFISLLALAKHLDRWLFTYIKMG